MREIALHILDIAENSITAGADCVHITIEEARVEDFFKIVIRDNGRGMSPEKLARLTDPFVTTRKTRRVGMGLALLAAATQRCMGELAATVLPHGGTEVVATFQYSHIDRAPLGDMAATLTTLIMGNPNADFVYTHSIDGHEVHVDTREIKKEMNGWSLTDPLIIRNVMDVIRSALKQLDAHGAQFEKKGNDDGKVDD